MKRIATAALDRRKAVATLYLRGMTQWEIARQFGVNQSTVSRDLEVLQAEWMKSAVTDLGEQKAKELARIDGLERVAWEAWERSCKDEETLHAETTKGRAGKDGPAPDLTRTSKTVKGQAGNPRFLERVEWCIATRLKLFGLLDSTSIDLSGTVNHNHNVNLKAATDEQLEQLGALLRRIEGPPAHVNGRSHG